MLEPLGQEYMVDTSKLGKFTAFEQAVSRLKTRMNTLLSDLSLPKVGLAYNDPMAIDPTPVTFKTYLPTLDSESDLFNTDQAIRYIHLQSQQMDNPISPNGVKNYIEQGQITPIRVNNMCLFTRTALDEFVDRYNKVSARPGLARLQISKRGTEI